MNNAMVRIIIEIDDNKNIKIVESKEDKTADLIVANHEKQKYYKHRDKHKSFNKKPIIIGNISYIESKHLDKKNIKITNKSRVYPKCNKEFNPLGNRQKYCSEVCGMHPKSEKEKMKLAKKPIESDQQISNEAVEPLAQTVDQVKSEPVKDRKGVVSRLFKKIKKRITEPSFIPLIESNIDTVDISDIKIKSLVTPEQIKLSKDKPFSDLRESQ
jgi:hypothetical protein